MDCIISLLIATLGVMPLDHVLVYVTEFLLVFLCTHSVLVMLLQLDFNLVLQYLLVVPMVHLFSETGYKRTFSHFSLSLLCAEYSANLCLYSCNGQLTPLSLASRSACSLFICSLSLSTTCAQLSTSFLSLSHTLYPTLLSAECSKNLCLYSCTGHFTSN